MIIDLEFKRFKTTEIREEVRQAYDQTQHRLDILKQQIKKEEAAGNKAQAEHILDIDVKKVEREADRYKEQMKQMDLDVMGSRQTNEHPDGYEGINQQLEHLRELQSMIHSYMGHNI